MENEEWATGPPDRRAAGPSRAVGRWAFGPPGHGGPCAAGRWAAGLLLAKPGMEWRSHGRDNDDLVSQLSRSGILKTQRVVKAMRKVDRGNYCTYSPYMDSPQSIGYGVTISAPHMHAHALEIDEFMLLIASWLIRATWREIQKGLYGNSKQNILYMTLLYRLSPS